MSGTYIIEVKQIHILRVKIDAANEQDAKLLVQQAIEAKNDDIVNFDNARCVATLPSRYWGAERLEQNFGTTRIENLEL